MSESAHRVAPPTHTTDSAPRTSPASRPSESAQRVAPASRTSESYVRTDVRTNGELLDPRGYVTYHNAHENHAAYLRRLGVKVCVGSRLRRAARRVIGTWTLGHVGRVERGGRS